jgi:hypothetical protein
MKKLFFLFLFLFSSIGWARTAPQDLRVPAMPDAKVLPLSNALAVVGVQVQGGFVSFGIVIYGQEPLVTIGWKKPLNLGAALTEIVSQVRGYTYEFVSDHLVDLYPSSLRSDREDPLNLLLHRVAIHAPAMDLFSAPSKFIPELKALEQNGKPVQGYGSLGPGLGAATAEIKLSLHDVTVKQVWMPPLLRTLDI